MVGKSQNCPESLLWPGLCKELVTARPLQGFGPKGVDCLVEKVAWGQAAGGTDLRSLWRIAK